MVPRVSSAPHGVETSIRRASDTRGGQGAIPDHKSFRTSTTPTYRRRTWLSPGSIPPRAVWKPQPGVRGASAQRHPGGIWSHPRVGNPSIHLKLQQTGDENGDPPGRYRPARCGNPNPAGRSLIGWGSRIKPASPGDDRVPPRIRNSSIHLQLRQPGDRPARCGNPSPTGLIGWGSYVEPAHPGEDRVPSLY